MYPTSFDYYAPTTMDEVLSLLHQYRDDAKLLAGGHSLLPVMKLRFAQPKHVIDLRKVPNLTGVREEANAVVVGAMTRYAEVQHSALVRGRLPVLAEAIALIGDPQVRNLGTVGGSLAHADPGADLPAVALALDAELVVRRGDGVRIIKAHDFFVDMMATALEPTEVLTEVRFPIPPGRAGEAYEKHKHPASGYALVGVAAVITLNGGDVFDRARVAVTGLGTKPGRALAVEKALIGRHADNGVFDTAAKSVADGVDIREDAQWSRAYKTNLPSAGARCQVTGVR
jgi:carbon-monoxide dehydrogenase medium subunit